MKDLVIGSITKLGWDRCKYWANSLNQSGFDGDKIICIFGQNEELAAKFRECGFEVINFRELTSSENIVVARFFVYYAILSDPKRSYRKVLATDVTDVVFQKNPSLYFDSLEDDTIIASSENLKYMHEAWGANNIKQVFGEVIATLMSDSTIYNAGVIAGDQRIIRDLFYLINTICESKPQYVIGDGGPDQAIYNYLLSLYPLSKHVNYEPHDSGWACQVGTTADPNKPHFNNYQLTPRPVMRNNRVCTESGKEYFIVHQYNRNPTWKYIIEENYK